MLALHVLSASFVGPAAVPGSLAAKAPAAAAVKMNYNAPFSYDSTSQTVYDYMDDMGQPVRMGMRGGYAGYGMRQGGQYNGYDEMRGYGMPGYGNGAYRGYGNSMSVPMSGYGMSGYMNQYNTQYTGGMYNWGRNAQERRMMRGGYGGY